MAGELKIVEIDPGAVRSGRADVDDPRRVRPLQCRKQGAGEHERRQMVDRERALVALDRLDSDAATSCRHC